MLDGHLKFLDYTKDLGLTLYYHEKLLWPCFEINCVIKGIKESDTNLFNLYILKLMNIENGINDKEISRLMGIPLEFVRLCLDNLVFNGLLEKDYKTLTTRGKEKIMEKVVEKDVNYHIYIDYFTKRVIPVLERQDSRESAFFEYGEKDYNYDYYGRINYFEHSSDEIAKDEAIKKHCYILDENEREVEEFISNPVGIDEMDVKRVLVSSGIISPSCKIRIDKEEKPKFIYRMIDLVIQKGDKSHLYASNGKGELSSFFTTLISSSSLPDSVQKRIDHIGRNALSSSKLNKKENESEENSIKKEKRKRDYLDPYLKNMIEDIKTINNLFTSLLKEQQITSDDKREKIEEKRQELTSLIYSFTEDALFYIAKNDKITPLSLSLDKISEDSYENKERSVRILKELGFDVPKQIEDLFLISRGKIEWSIKNTPSLFGLLSALLVLSEESTSYFFRKFAKEKRDPFIKVLRDIKSKRDKVSHEDEEVSGGDLVLYKDWMIIKDRILPFIDDAFIFDLKIQNKILKSEKNEIKKCTKGRREAIILHISSTLKNSKELLEKNKKTSSLDNAINLSSMENSEIINVMETVIKCLDGNLGNIEKDLFLSFYEDEKIESENEEEEKEIKILTSLHNDLSFATTNNLSLELYKTLKKIYEYSLDENNVKSAIIKKLYILYSLLFDILKESLKGEMISYDYVSKCPLCFQKDAKEMKNAISEEKVRKELEGTKVSLEAGVLSYLMRENREELARMGKRVPLLLKDIREISKFRGHTKIASEEEILGHEEKDYKKMIKELSEKLLGYKERAVTFIKYISENGYFG